MFKSTQPCTQTLLRNLAGTLNTRPPEPCTRYTHRALKGPYRSKGRGKNKIPKTQKNMFFALYGRWEALVCRKILLQGLGTFSRPGKPISEKYVLAIYRGDRGGRRRRRRRRRRNTPSHPPSPNVPRDQIFRKGNPSLRLYSAFIYVILDAFDSPICMFRVCLMYKLKCNCSWYNA